MSRKKLQHIQQCYTLPNVITEPTTLCTNNNQDVVLEVGCGHGAYTLELAALYPRQCFFGVDRKPDRLWVGATSALERNLTNASFIVSDTSQLDRFFPDHSISAIWLPFPDPQPRTKYAKRRLIALPYLQLYKRLLKPHGTVHLKTDNANLIAEAQINLVPLNGKIHQQSNNFIDTIYTTYEQRYRALGKSIFYLEFSF